MKIVFMGTPQFAVPTLQAISDANHEIGYVVTQPDRKRNRGGKVTYSEIKQKAIELELEVLQPEKIRTDHHTIDIIKKYAPDIIVVVAYGQILTEEILNIPLYGCVNVHASLLPRWRGASPIHHAILSGDDKTGVTIMKMDVGLDTGDMLTKIECEIGSKSYDMLHDELSMSGAKLLIETLSLIEKNATEPQKQDEEHVTYANLIRKEDGKIDFDSAPEETERQVRALHKWPGVFCQYGEETMKLCKVSPKTNSERNDTSNGTIIKVGNSSFDIICGGRILEVFELQMPGKRRMSVNDYLKGNEIKENTILK